VTHITDKGIIGLYHIFLFITFEQEVILISSFRTLSKISLGMKVLKN